MNPLQDMPSIAVRGLAVHYQAPWGLPTASDQLLLLVHGAGGSSRHWEPMLKAMREMPLVGIPVAVDLPGHGATAGCVPDSIDAVADFLNAFLEQLNVNQPICYVGQSMGGLIGLNFTLNYPHRVARLVLMATAARIQLHPDFLQQAMNGQWDMSLLRQSFAPEIPEHLQELVLHEFQYTRLKADATDFMGVSSVDLSKTISALQVPTLILSGDDDVIISPRKSTILQRQISGSRLVTLPAGGHYLHVEQSERVAQEVTQFLQESYAIPVSTSV